MIEMQYNFPLLAGQGEEWRDRLRSAVDGLHAGDANELRPTFRMDRTAQREIAARWLDAPTERTWVTCGGHHGTLVALLAAGLAGKTIAVDDVTYTGILEQGRMLGSRLLGVAFDDEGMRADALREVCAREASAGRETSAGGGVSAIYTMPTVHNPLGCVAGLERRRAIVEVAREFDLVIVEDDAYGYMERAAPPSYAVLAPERTFYVRGLSKSYAPATRTGFLVMPERFASAVESAIKNTATGTSLVHCVAALSLIADGTVDRIMEAKRAEGARRNAAARELLGEAAAPGARCAWHLWVRSPEGMSAAAAQALCAERGVMVSGAQGFVVPGTAVPGALRIALGGEVEAERMLEGVRVVAQVVRPHP
jgi:DNA-binding transcriptional MocR family regulator